MRERLIILLILLLTGYSGFSQTNEQNLLLYRGNREYKLKNYEEAQKYYEKALDAGSKDSKVHFNLGDAYYKQGKYDEAAKKFEELTTTTKKNNTPRTKTE